jgi:hypothetical protein
MGANSDRVDNPADSRRPPAPPSDGDGTAVHQGLGARVLQWLKHSPGLHAVVIVVLAFTAGSLAVMRAVDVARIERRAAEERAVLVRTATDALTAQTSALLRLSALPLGWAVRSALLKDDLNSVDTYLQKIVQEPHVTGAAFVGPDGKVRLASNRKLEGHPATEAFPGVAINQQSPTTIAGERDVRVIVPVMGYDRRLGTVILSYLRPMGSDLEKAPSGPR